LGEESGEEDDNSTDLATKENVDQMGVNATEEQLKMFIAQRELTEEVSHNV
jgi:hypothetical protein